MHDPLARQALLELLPNPLPEMDYISHLSQEISLPGAAKLLVTIRYVPDRTILMESSLARYMQALVNTPMPETLCAMLLEDANNTLIPRWVHVEIVIRRGAQEHHSTAEDRQPKWQNPGLLSRLKPI